MKNLITACACMLILAIYILQFAAGEASYSKLVFAEKTSYEYLDKVKMEGNFSDKIKGELKGELSVGLGVSKDEITITSTIGYVKRGGKIEYEISFPIYGVIGAPGIFRIGDNENKAVKTISGVVFSEGNPE